MGTLKRSRNSIFDKCNKSKSKTRRLGISECYRKIIKTSYFPIDCLVFISDEEFLEKTEGWGKDGEIKFEETKPITD